jgi:phosphatidylinositol alpha-1,6-mannosyltransferase
MRLLVISNDYPPKPGGIQQYLYGLVNAYPYPVRVLAPADPDAGPDARVVRHRRSFMWPTPSVSKWIEAQAADFAPDFILFGAPTPLPRLGERLRSSLGIPFAVLCHGAELTVPGAVPGLRRLIAGPLKAADVRLAVSEYTGGVVRHLSKRPVDVIGSGVDAAQFAPDGSRDGATIGCVSRFVPRKGQHRLLDAAAELRRRGRDVDVLLVGSGRMEKTLRRRVQRLGVPTQFEIAVPWERLGALYRQMDVFCMPCRSRWFGLEAEGFGLVYLEAAATALPVLAGTSGGAPETVVPGETGFVVDTVDHIVEAVEMLLDDPERARSMGEKGRHRVLKHFTWLATTGRLVAALEAAGA